MVIQLCIVQVKVFIVKLTHIYKDTNKSFFFLEIWHYDILIS